MNWACKATDVTKIAVKIDAAIIKIIEKAKITSAAPQAITTYPAGH